MKASVLLACTGVAALASAFPSFPNLDANRPRQANPNTPCAKVSQLVANIPPGAARTVPAGVAYECITSVPFNATSAKKLLASLPPYFNWQSTLTALKNPPAEYREKVQPPIDILGGLDKIAADIDAGRFSNEYEFGWTLYTLVQSAHDGHFSYVPDSVGGVFTYGRPVPLVSVSADGKQLPAVFAFHDVLGMQYKNISYIPSPVAQIDGQSVNDFLENLSQHGALQDRDALYNNLFYELAQVSLGTSGTGTGFFTGGGRGRFVYPGPTTTLKFKNGTQYTMQNYARVLGPFRGINSGEQLAQRYFTYGADTQVQSQTVENKVSPAALADSPPGYPVPVVPGPQSIINGFYLADSKYQDVAVLQVPNFVGSASQAIPFQQTTREFLRKAAADGKQKLIIDLQANGGGTILQGYDMFKQLFPDLSPWGANRFRANEAVDLIGQSFSAYASQFPRVPTTNTTLLQFQGSYFDYHNDMKPNPKPFESWQDKFGPVEANGDKYTKTARWNLSDVHITYSSGGINITGYGPLANVTGQPVFKPANIVILTDGYCASTCTIFAEFLTKQTDVKTIALGGRSNRDPIQAIGGVKGVNNYQFAYIQSLAQTAVNIAPAEEKAKFSNSVLRQYYNTLPFSRAGAAPGVNNRDGIMLGDKTGVALQFIYEEADCRLYYTPEMTVDATAIWKAAADASWGNDGQCVSSGYGDEKREVHEVTRELKPRRVQVSQAVALRQYEMFERTFALETECKLSGDGFMSP
ncbi:peptidase S41 family protein-like protein [Massariosphaeria phaeospora]|uniref:Peptidase S41 family protein-like protein n=1 Tax=Massariosphaeria phaeospora TaxID=100035 RepID=A0A7C8M102_9PLEO|nr:peptidase S41 family protein-like protein [Massariosphaeria phaeospora]